MTAQAPARCCSQRCRLAAAASPGPPPARAMRPTAPVSRRGLQSKATRRAPAPAESAPPPRIRAACPGRPGRDDHSQAAALGHGHGYPPWLSRSLVFRSNGNSRFECRIRVNRGSSWTPVVVAGQGRHESPTTGLSAPTTRTSGPEPPRPTPLTRKEAPAAALLPSRQTGRLASLPILWSDDDSDLARARPGRPAAHPTVGWDEELRARTAGVRLPRPGALRVID